VTYFLVRRETHGMSAVGGASDRLLANVAQIGGDFVGQHFFEAEPEKMRRIAAVWPGDDIAAYATDSATIVSSSREARDLGIKTGMKVFEAKAIFPAIVIREPNPPLYRAASDQLIDILCEKMGIEKKHALPKGIGRKALKEKIRALKQRRVLFPPCSFTNIWTIRDGAGV